MSGTVLAAAGVLVGLALGIVVDVSTVRRLRRRNRELRAALNEGREPAKPETMKKFVWACVVNGFLWVWCSYILAAMDKPQIAEELTKVALIEIIAPVAVYAFKSGVENLSKYNNWPDKGAPVEAAPPEIAPTDESGGEEGGVG